MNNLRSKIETPNLVGELVSSNEVMTRMLLASFGANGHEFVEDDTFETSVFCAIMAFGGDAEVSYSVVQMDGTQISHSAKTVLSTDPPIYGRIINLDVSSGIMLAYYYI